MADLEDQIFVARLPRVVVALDVETTGLSRHDRVASIGMVRLEVDASLTGDVAIQQAHAYCNPGRPSHPMAYAVHKIPDAFLAQQGPFSDVVGGVLALLDGAEAVIAHNASFDLRFLGRELAACGWTAPLPPPICTLALTGLTLEAAITQIGLGRSAKAHNALEDAWFALLVYLAAMGAPARLMAQIRGGLG